MESAFVIGFIDSDLGPTDGRAVWNPERTITLAVDESSPITRERCEAILAAGRKLSGRPLTTIHIHGAQKKYVYSNGCLTIYRDGEPVYENNNGKVCRDAVALADSY